MKRTLTVLAMSLFAATAAIAAEPAEFHLTLKKHVYTPSTLEIPANTKVKLIVDNQDDSPEEFESSDLGREKVIPANSKGTVLIGPLKPGTYSFVGEFHEETARGTIVVK